MTITELGLKYNLLTRFTSFIAVDSVVRADSGSAVTVKQPLPLPEGVPETTIGDRANYGGGRITVSDISGNQARIEQSVIESIYPNLFDSCTNIRLFLEKADLENTISLNIYNSAGQLVARLVIKTAVEGWQEIRPDLRAEYPGLCAGVYNVVLYFGETRKETQRLLYLKG